MEPIIRNTDEMLPSYESEMLQQLLLLSANLDPPPEQQIMPTSENMSSSTSSAPIMNDSISLPRKEMVEATQSKSRKRPVTTSTHSVTRDTRSRSKSHSKAIKTAQFQSVPNSTLHQVLSTTSTMTAIQTPLVGNANPSLRTSHSNVVTSAISHPISKCHLEPTLHSMAESFLTNEPLNATTTSNAVDDFRNLFDSTLILGKLFDQFIAPTFIDVSPVGRTIRAQYYRSLTLELTMQTIKHLSFVTPELVLNNFLEILRKLNLVN